MGHVVTWEMTPLPCIIMIDRLIVENIFNSIFKLINQIYIYRDSNRMQVQLIQLVYELFVHVYVFYMDKKIVRKKKKN